MGKWNGLPDAELAGRSPNFADRESVEVMPVWCESPIESDVFKKAQAYSQKVLDELVKPGSILNGGV